MRALLLAVAMLLLAGCAAGPDLAQDTPSVAFPGSASSPEPSGTRVDGSTSRFPGCEGSGPVMLRNSPMRPDDFPNLQPYGVVVGGHVTPIDHMYFAPPPGSRRDMFEVRAIADGVVFGLQPRDTKVEANAPALREWRIDIAHTCTFTSYFDLLTSLSPRLQDVAERMQRNEATGPIHVAAGEVVGRIGAQTLDFGVYDYDVTLPGFLVPAHYEREPWKVHTVDPFPHFVQPVREMLLSKMLRTVEPRAGRIDYDAEGRLVGNWFRQGTNGYAGDGRWDYWDGHLSLAPNMLDPSHPIFSIGNWSGHPAQFAVRDAAFDPAVVDPATGPVKVELVRYGYTARNRDGTTGFEGANPLKPGDDIIVVPYSALEGTALMQLIGPRLLRLETFPATAADAVDGFTTAAVLYER